jgi:hypothetical protein
MNVAASGLETSLAIGEEELDFRDTRLLHLDGWFFHCEAKDDADRMLTLLPQPNYGPPELCFPDAPPGEVPGIFTRGFGKGRAVYLPWLPEWLYFRDGMPEHRELLVQLIGQSSRAPVRLVGAGPLEVTVRAREQGTGEIVVHLVNYAGQRQSAYDEHPAIGNLRLGVRGDARPAKALVAATTVEVGTPDAEGYAWLDVPDVKYFEAILLPADKG